MANDLLNPPKDDAAQEAGLDSKNGTGAYSTSEAPTETGHELDAFLGKAFEEKPFWKDLYDNVHDTFFPPKLPPLELTSTPIPVADPMAVKRSPAAIAISALINLSVLGLLLFAFRHQIVKALPNRFTNINIDVSAFKPQTKKAGDMGGGGGGGAHDIVPVVKGHLPEIKKNPIVPPQVAKLDHPQIPVPAAIDVQAIKLPDNPNLPLIGVTNSPNVSLASNGSGSSGGMGSGSRGGLGSGNGNGFGPGQDGNVGGGLRRVGDGVSAPSLIYKVEAEFSDEARRAKYEGIVVVSLIVDANGNPQQAHVSRSLGMGLDEKALEAVRQYKFKPARDQKTGKNVPVAMSVEISFHLY